MVSNYNILQEGSYDCLIFFFQGLVKYVDKRDIYFRKDYKKQLVNILYFDLEKYINYHIFPRLFI